MEILRQFYRCADKMMAPNNELVDFTNRLTGKPCHMMSRGVDTDAFSPKYRKRVNKKLQIGYVGRLTPEKNVRFLATLAQKLQRTCQQDFEFVIIGEGSEERWLRNHVPNAQLPGVLRGETLAAAYANMDLFVFPSLTDTFGNVVLEALASGVPAVVSSQGGPKFLVQPGVTGFVATSEDEFTNSVERLAKDSVLRARMSLAAVDYAQEQSWDRVFESVWKIYEDGVARHQSTAHMGRASSSLLSSRVHGRSCP